MLNFVAACSVCAQAKVTHQSPQGLLQPFPIPHRPWSHIPLDFVTGFPPSNHHTTIVMIADRFSKAVKPLQLVQNAAARILARTKRFEHITPVLASLHWLPIKFWH